MATMDDVAKKAGVSRGTVSNVINNVKVKAASKEKVDAAIKALGYVPNIAARELKTNKTSMVVFIVPTIWNPFFSELTYYLQKELFAHGLKLLLCNSEEDYTKELEYIEMAKQHKVMGIISVSYSDIASYLDPSIPFVSIERYYNERIPSVTSDNIGGAHLAVETLVARGCKKLLYVTRKNEKNSSMIDRLQGFVDYVKLHEIEYDIFNPVVASYDFRSELTWYLQKVLKNNHYDGIFCGSDRYANYVVEILREEGYRVPEDIQVIGFDGATNYEHDALRVSTIAQPIAELAAEAVKLLIDLGNQNVRTSQIVLPVTFVDAGTTK